VRRIDRRLPCRYVDRDVHGGQHGLGPHLAQGRHAVRQNTHVIGLLLAQHVPEHRGHVVDGTSRRKDERHVARNQRLRHGIDELAPEIDVEQGRVDLAMAFDEIERARHIRGRADNGCT
jgi:hypothetical protein